MGVCWSDSNDDFVVNVVEYSPYRVVEGLVL